MLPLLPAGQTVCQSVGLNFTEAVGLDQIEEVEGDVGSVLCGPPCEPIEGACSHCVSFDGGEGNCKDLESINTLNISGFDTICCSPEISSAGELCSVKVVSSVFGNFTLPCSLNGTASPTFETGSPTRSPTEQEQIPTAAPVDVLSPVTPTLPPFSAGNSIYLSSFAFGLLSFLIAAFILI